MDLLTKDREDFETLFPAAAAFLRGARLRSELFGYVVRDPKLLTQYDLWRARELLELQDRQGWPSWFRQMRAVERRRERWRQQVIELPPVPDSGEPEAWV